MRIAMFNDNFYPEMSGISDSIIESARALVKMGHSVDFYVPQYPEKDYLVCNVPFKELELGEGINIHRFFSLRTAAGTGQGRMVVPSFLRWIAMRKNRPDVIHTHLCFGTGLEGLAASRFLRVPFVGSNHTPITEFLKYGPVQNKLIDKIALNYVSWFYNRCEFVSAPCSAIFTEMEANGFRKKHKVISNPIDLKNFFPTSGADEKTEIKKEFGLSDFTVLYTGRLSEEKYVDVIIRAIAMAKEKISNVTLAITGHGVAEEELKKLAKELGLEDKVKFFGTLSVDKHARIYKAADVFAIASTAEMQSLSLMKAFATSVPAIGVNAWALPEYINDKNGFIVEPGDVSGMAEKIIYLYDNPQVRERLGQGGKAMVANFSPARIAAEWAEIYESVIKK